MNSADTIENVLFDDIAIGQSARLVRTLSLDDIHAFAAVSGDVNPAHLDDEYAGESLFHGIIGHGMWSGSLISTVLGTQFPGPGTIYMGQTLSFRRPVRIGDTLTVTVTAVEKNPEKHSLVLDCLITNQHEETVVKGQATVLAPTAKIIRPRIDAPKLHLFDPASRVKAFIKRLNGIDPSLCAVVHPCDQVSLQAAVSAAEANLITPVLVGPAERIQQVAEEAELDISQMKINSVPHSHAAANLATQLAAESQIEMMYKGSLDTREFLHAVLSRPELRTKRRLSHVFRFETPFYGKPLLISDAGLNIAPDLQQKQDIIQNAISLAHILGNPLPKVALLSAIETLHPNIQSTLDAGILCKMADRGQITGGLLDGPLAFDNAISPESSAIKSIKSQVAGDADILIAPDLEAANILCKQFECLAGATASGTVLGAKVPIALAGRADSASTRLMSIAMAALVANHYRNHSP